MTPRLQPLADQAQHAPVRDPVLEELQHPPVVDGVVEPTVVRIEHPIHLPPQDPDRERIQRLMRAAPRPKPVGETPEVRLVDGVEHLDDGSLKELVLQCGNTQRSLPPVRLRDVHPPRRSRPVAGPVNPGVQIPKVHFEILPVIHPRHPVYPRRGLGLQRPVGRPQAVDVDVVQERGESCLLVLPCDSTHAIQRTWRAMSGSVSGTRVAGHVPLAQAPFLHHLRGRQAGVVRRFRRYYGPVRLPTTVHLRRAASAFPERPALPSRRRAAVGPPGSRARRLHACTGSQTARGPPTARDNAADGVAFHLVQRRRHPGTLISRLHSPACVYPTDASPPSLRAADARLGAIVCR
jgi:hypothetical protein